MIHKFFMNKAKGKSTESHKTTRILLYKSPYMIKKY